MTGLLRRIRDSGPMLLSLIPALLLALMLVGVWLANPDIQEQAVVAWDLLWEGEPDAIQDWLRGFGFWAPVVSGLLQLVTSLFPPGPSFLLGIVNAMLYGMVLGGILTFVTALASAAACFGIARLVGRPGMERFLSPRRLTQVDEFMQKRGVLAVFVARLIPFINPDIVSYAAGVTGIRLVPFLLGVGAGAVPSTIFYSVVGARAMEATGWVFLAVTGATILPLLFLALFGQRLWRRYRSRREEGGDPGISE